MRLHGAGGGGPCAGGHQQQRGQQRAKGRTEELKGRQGADGAGACGLAAVGGGCRGVLAQVGDCTLLGRVARLQQVAQGVHAAGLQQAGQQKLAQVFDVDVVDVRVARLHAQALGQAGAQQQG